MKILRLYDSEKRFYSDTAGMSESCSCNIVYRRRPTYEHRPRFKRRHDVPLLTLEGDKSYVCNLGNRCGAGSCVSALSLYRIRGQQFRICRVGF
jgi:hypothetical protein